MKGQCQKDKYWRSGQLLERYSKNLSESPSQPFKPSSLSFGRHLGMREMVFFCLFLTHLLSKRDSRFGLFMMRDSRSESS